MRHFASIIGFFIFCFAQAQVSCNFSQISPSNIFYKGTNTNYTAGGNVLYVCGPNVSVFDTSDAAPNCHIAFVEGGSVFVFKHGKCRGINTVYLRNNSTLVIKSGSSLPIVYMEPTAKVINEDGLFLEAHNCVSLEFPPVNCLSGGRSTNPGAHVQIFHEQGRETVDIVAVNFGSEPERICFINNTGEKVAEVNFTNRVDISSLQDGFYTVKVYSKYNPAGAFSKFPKH